MDVEGGGRVAEWIWQVFRRTSELGTEYKHFSTVGPIAKCNASQEGSDRPGIFTTRTAATA